MVQRKNIRFSRYLLNMVKQLLREAIAFNGLVSEIDWENTFSDVKKTCIPVKDLVEYLNRVRKNARVKYGEREKFNKGYPFVHSKSSFFNKGTEVDIEFFIKEITKKPNSLINTNEKIMKSGGLHEFVYKTGIPAIRGIAYDISKNEFYYINTCPSAGECMSICYALKGRYIQYPVSYDLMTRRLNFMLNYPDDYEKQLYSEIKAKAVEHKALTGYKNTLILRWNDSGDFFTKKYIGIAESVIERLNKDGYNVKSYAYTKMSDVANTSKNVQSTFSMGGNKKELDKIDLNNKKTAQWIPKEVFKDLDLMKISDEIKLKERVSKLFNLPQKYILTYDELMSTPKAKTQKWFVIVTPDDGDDAAFREDVKMVFLTQH